jgi:hypothetical protein
MRWLLLICLVSSATLASARDHGLSQPRLAAKANKARARTLSCEVCERPSAILAPPPAKVPVDNLPRL